MIDDGKLLDAVGEVICVIEPSTEAERIAMRRLIDALGEYICREMEEVGIDWSTGYTGE